MTAVLASFSGTSSQSGFGASASPDTVNGYYRGSSGAAQNITTGAVRASVTGALGSPTYAWVQTGASAYTWTINSPSAASTTFTAASVGAGSDASAAFTCIVTDSGRTTYAVVTANVYNESTA